MNSWSFLPFGIIQWLTLPKFMAHNRNVDQLFFIALTLWIRDWSVFAWQPAQSHPSPRWRLLGMTTTATAVVIAGGDLLLLSSCERARSKPELIFIILSKHTSQWFTLTSEGEEWLLDEVWSQFKDPHGIFIRKQDLPLRDTKLPFRRILSAFKHCWSLLQQLWSSPGFILGLANITTIASAHFTSKGNPNALTCFFLLFFPRDKALYFVSVLVLFCI